VAISSPLPTVDERGLVPCIDHGTAGMQLDDLSAMEQPDEPQAVHAGMRPDKIAAGEIERRPPELLGVGEQPCIRELAEIGIEALQMLGQQIAPGAQRAVCRGNQELGEGHPLG
jgi:hypothetical protein